MKKILKKMLIIILVILIISISTCTTKRTTQTQSYVEIDNKKIFVEIPRTPQEYMIGLMYRQELCEECGMLFVFPSEDYHSFWMKNTLLPLDMVFINSNLEVVDVLHAEPCTQEPCERYIPKEKALYVLETNQNLFNKETIGKKASIVIS